MNKKVIGNAVFLFLVLMATVYYVFHNQDISNIIEYVQQVDAIYWIIGVFCVVIFISFESFIIFYLMRSVKQKVKFFHCILYSFAGFFFSCVTPSATGGQPAQVYFMKKDGISISVSSLILMIVTITYKAVLVVIGCLVLIIRPKGVIEYLDPVIGWCYLGIVLNIIVVSGMVILIFSPRLASKMVMALAKVFQRLFIKRKHGDKIIQKIETSMEKYENVSDYIKKHIFLLINVFFITFVQRIILFAITYLIYKSFGFTNESFIQIVTLQAMISVAVDMLPLPGGMGISESIFMKIFEPILGSQLLLPVMVASRGLSYYSQLIISAVITVVAYFIIGRAKEKNDRIL